MKYDDGGEGLAVGGFRWEEIINYFAATKCASVGGTGYWIIVSLSLTVPAVS